LTFNAGAGQTSASLWEVEYLYNFSKRTRVSLGYVSISNDAGARYNLGGFAQPTTGNSSVNAFVTTIKSTF
jgi:predicted porin